MTEERGQLGERGIVEVLTRLYQRRASGVLKLDSGSEQESLFLLGGELYLGPEHRLAQFAAQELEGGDAGERSSWTSRVDDWLGGWGGAEWVFEEGIGGLVSDLVGPLPTASLIMGLSVLGLDEFQLLKRLGGEERTWVAAAASALPKTLPELDPQEAFLLSRMERPLSAHELLRQPDLDRREGLERLCRLLSVGLIVPAEKAEMPEAASIMTPEMTERFSERIASSLEREPLDLEPQQHRAQLVDLLGRLGEMTHYKLLGVDVGSSTDEIHDAYLELARLVHPSHAASLGLAAGPGAMRLIFERATEAYLTLSDSERSRLYLLRVGSAVDGPRTKPTREEREQEATELAKHNFRMARSMADRHEYHFAIELLHQAIRADPRAEYFALLADCQAENPQWLGKAISSYRRAVELKPEDANLRVGLAQVLEKAGHPAHAVEQLEEALMYAPGHHEAVYALHRLQSAVQAKPEGGWLDRLRSWLRG